MPTTSGGLNFTYPSEDSTGWNATLVTLFNVLSGHDHSGAPNGGTIPTAGIADNAVDEDKIRLDNAGWLTARNNADDGDINILNVNTSDAVVLLDEAQLQTSAAPTTDAQIANKKYVDDEITTAIAAVPNGLTWSEVTTATKTAAVNNGYVLNRSGGVTVTIPSTAAVGSVVKIIGKQGIWIIAQNAGETISFNGTDATTGATGTLTATNEDNCIELVCITANTNWVVSFCSGNITIA